MVELEGEFVAGRLEVRDRVLVWLRPEGAQAPGESI